MADLIFIDNYYYRGGKLCGDVCTRELRMNGYYEERQAGSSWEAIDKKDLAHIEATKVYCGVNELGEPEYRREQPREFIWGEYLYETREDGELYIKGSKHNGKNVVLVNPDSFFAKPQKKTGKKKSKR